MVFQYLGTSSGRLLLQVTAIAGSFGASACYYLPNTLFLDKYKAFVQSYEKGAGQEVSAKVKKLYEEVLSDMKLREVDKENIEIFTVYGFDLFHAGSFLLRSGAIIGVPVNFAYDSEKDVNRNIKVIDKPIDWGSETGEILKDSLVLSDEARKFGLARELNETSTSSVWLHTCYPAGAILATYMLSRALNDKLRIRNHPFRFIMYSLVGAFMSAMYIACTDLTTSIIEEQSDQAVALISPAYAQGGVEFYKKLQLRNQALRQLMGAAGENQYSATGNENIFIRMKHLPLSERLRNLQNICEDISSESKENI